MSVPEQRDRLHHPGDMFAAPYTRAQARHHRYQVTGAASDTVGVLLYPTGPVHALDRVGFATVCAEPLDGAVAVTDVQRLVYGLQWCPRCLS